MRELRERQVCSCCEGRGIITREDPQPGKWFTSMGLTYEPGVEFNLISGPKYDSIWYGRQKVDSGSSDLYETCESRNDQLRADLSTREACSNCKGVGTIPKPLDREDQAYDRGELLAEAAAAGGMQAYNDMQDEWSEYVSGTGSHADDLQKQIDADWDRQVRMGSRLDFDRFSSDERDF